MLGFVRWLPVTASFNLGLECVSLGRLGGGAGGAAFEVFDIRNATLRVGDVIPRVRKLLAMDLAHVNASLFLRD